MHARAPGRQPSPEPGHGGFLTDVTQGTARQAIDRGHDTGTHDQRHVALLVLTDVLVWEHVAEMNWTTTASGTNDRSRAGLAQQSRRVSRLNWSMCLLGTLSAQMCTIDPEIRRFAHEPGTGHAHSFSMCALGVTPQPWRSRPSGSGASWHQP